MAGISVVENCFAGSCFVGSVASTRSLIRSGSSSHLFVAHAPWGGSSIIMLEDSEIGSRVSV